MNAILFRDMLYNMLLGLMALVIIILPSINPPAQDAAAQLPPGNMTISAAWPEGPVDVDLWVSGPGDKPVGYSRRGGKLFNLLRDDLGNVNDSTPMNFETAYSRGLPAGEYTVNVHLYRGRAPVPVSVEVRFGPTGEQSRLFVTETMVLAAEGQERTVVSFRLDDRGNVTAIDKVYRPLRSAGK